MSGAFGALPPSASQRLAYNKGKVDGDTASGDGDSLAALSDRLAHELFFYRATLQALPAGMIMHPPPLVNNQYVNQLIVSLSSGTVNIYVGGPTPSNLLYQFNASANPEFLPIFPQIMASVTIECDTLSGDAATGTIDFICA